METDNTVSLVLHCLSSAICIVTNRFVQEACGSFVAPPWHPVGVKGEGVADKPG